MSAFASVPSRFISLFLLVVVLTEDFVQTSKTRSFHNLLYPFKVTDQGACTADFGGLI